MNRFRPPRHLSVNIYIIKQDIRILYVAYSWPNCRTDWAEFFVETHEWPRGVIGENFFKNILKKNSTGNAGLFS